MDLDARPFRCFIAVAEENSFSRAASRLNISQPALSAIIKELERRLGFFLFIRSSRHVALTSEGRLFLGNARRFVSEAKIASRAASEIRTNEVRIGTGIDTLLVPERVALLDKFASDHPGVPLQVLNDDHARALLRLARQEIDVIIAIEPYPPYEGESSGSQLLEDDLGGKPERLVLFEKAIELLIPAEHELARLEEIPFDALANIEIAVPNRFHGVLLSEAISYRLSAAGANLVRPPEGNAIAVEQFAERKRIAAISIGWFVYRIAPAIGMIRRPVVGLNLATALSLVRLQGHQRPGAQLLWSSAMAWAAERDAPQPDFIDPR